MVCSGRKRQYIIGSTPSLRSLSNVVLSIVMQHIYIIIIIWWGGGGRVRGCGGGGGGGGCFDLQLPTAESCWFDLCKRRAERLSRDVFDTFATHPDLVHDVSDRLLSTAISTPGRVFATYKPWFLTNGKRNRAKNCCVSIFALYHSYH